MGAQEITLGAPDNGIRGQAGGKWGFGQNRQERKYAIKLNIVVDVIGQYVLNANGGEAE